MIKPRKKIIFLDRDGVINKKPPKADYVKSWKEFEFLPGAIVGLRFLTEHGFEIFIITNQAGIARGLMTEEDLKEIHRKFLETCNKNEINIKQIYYCPHGWNDGCDCRKPKPGMLLKAAKDYDFDNTKAIFIGDDKRDQLTGEAVGCKTFLMRPNGNLLNFLHSINV